MNPKDSPPGYACSTKVRYGDSRIFRKMVPYLRLQTRFLGCRAALFRCRLTSGESKTYRPRSFIDLTNQGPLFHIAVYCREQLNCNKTNMRVFCGASSKIYSGVSWHVARDGRSNQQEKKDKGQTRRASNDDKEVGCKRAEASSGPMQAKRGSATMWDTLDRRTIVAKNREQLRPRSQP